MSRAFCVPGVIFLGIALVLSFLSSISLPYLPALDITRTQVESGAIQKGQTGFGEVRFGVWAFCAYDKDEKRTCSPTGHGYKVQFFNHDLTQTVTIGSSWTRGLAVHPVATGITFIAFAMSFSQHLTVTLLASLVSFLAALLTLIAFAIDIALFAYLKHQVNKLSDVHATTKTGAGFWLTFVSLICLLFAGCTVCFGRRKLTGATEYPMLSVHRKPWWSRFRKE